MNGNENNMNMFEEHMMSLDEGIDLEEDEEEECRVCRGPAEEGRSLFQPCKCSGSIGLTHQDCLTSWLAIKGGRGCCDLCSTKFKFAPQYEVNAPVSLSPMEVVAGLIHRAILRWFPFALRLIFALGLWLCALPLATAYLYQGWMNRPSSVPSRWKWELLISDTISGAVIAAAIILSFLCIMSFADFLRFHWQQDRAEGQDETNETSQGLGHEINDSKILEEGIVDVLPIWVEEPRIRLHCKSGPQVVGVMDQGELFLHEQMNEGHKGNSNSTMYNEFSNNSINRRMGNCVQPNFREDDELQGGSYLLPSEKMSPRSKQANTALTINQDQTSFSAEKVDIFDNLSLSRRDLSTGSALRRQRQTDLLQQQILDGTDFNKDTNECLNNVGNNFNVSKNIESRNKLEIPISSTQDEDMEMERMIKLQEEEENDDRQMMNGNIRDHNEDQILHEEEQRFEPHMEPGENDVDPDDRMDMDMHVALDELLGLRGPLSSLIRNLLWLLAFNTAYLALFAFIPHSTGISTHSFLRTFFSHGERILTQSRIFEKLQVLAPVFLKNLRLPITDKMTVIMGKESTRVDSLFNFSDIATITLGYLSIASTVLLLQSLVHLIKFMWKGIEMSRSNTSQPASSNKSNELLNEERIRFQDFEDVPRVDWNRDNNDQDPLAGVDIKALILKKLFVTLECSAAIVKVGILIFLKMLLLPLLLGICLDLSTLDLFESSLERRLNYAGADIFGSLSVHWVAGITFMLFVTVSVLQLREVIHPDVLSMVIRPQEPQPDLLGNLLQESGYTHTKRMTLSLAIYVGLLCIYVWLPFNIVVQLGIRKYLPFSSPKVWYYFRPQLQLPLELLVFHLSMLAFLEKYKNRIGEMLHFWLLAICSVLNITDNLLPKAVKQFEFIGSYHVYTTEDSCKIESDKTTSGALLRHSSMENQSSKKYLVDSFWSELSSMTAISESTADTFIESHIFQFNNTSADQYFETIENPNPNENHDGRRVLDASQTHIRLPTKKVSSSTSKSFLLGDAMLLPTAIGPYRLRRSKAGTLCHELPTIEFWREIVGKPIARPPAGWDDLSAGGAVAQGRWAWGKEQKSAIEQSVARRKNFFPTYQNQDCLGKSKSNYQLETVLFVVLKLVTLLTLSWLAILLSACVTLSSPLLLGRFIFFLLRVSEYYIHDPFAIALGSFILFPLTSRAINALSTMKLEIEKYSLLGYFWKRTIFGSRPPQGSDKMKVIIQSCLLWFIISPLLLGLSYELFFVKSSSFWSKTYIDLQSLAFSWGVGVILLHFWAALCYYGVFRLSFWARLGLIALNEEEKDGNRKKADSGNNKECWQGSDGIIYRFINIIRLVFVKLEWDQVDRLTLLDNCLYPIALQLLMTLVGPLVASFSISMIGYLFTQKMSIGVMFPFFGCVEKGRCSMLLYRLFACITVALQLVAACKHPLARWFKAAHKIAHDDRYLIGKVLLNYNGE